MNYQVKISPVTSQQAAVVELLHKFLGPDQKDKIDGLIKNGGTVRQNLNKQAATTIANQLMALGVTVQVIGMTNDETNQGYLIRLLSAGNSKLKVVNVVRNFTKLGLKESKDLVDNLEVLAENLSKEDAESFAGLLREAGAEVRIEEMGTTPDKKSIKIKGSTRTSDILKERDPSLKLILDVEIKRYIINSLDAAKDLAEAISGIPLDSEDFKDQTISAVIDNIKNKVDSQYKEVIDQYLSDMDRKGDKVTVKDLLGLDLPLSKNPLFSDAWLRYNSRKLGDLIKAKDLDLDTEVEIPYLLDTSISQQSLILNRWKTEKNWTNDDFERIDNTLDLMRITGNQADILEGLSEKGVQKPKDLVTFDEDTLISVITKAETGLSDEETTIFSKQILLGIENDYPSAYLMHRLIEKPEWFNLDKKDIPGVSNNLKSFYQQNKDFDLMGKSIISGDTGLLNEEIKGVNPTPELIRELSKVQQALRISPDTDIAALLVAKGIDVNEAVNHTHKYLMRNLGVDLPIAYLIKDKAQEYHIMAMNGFLSLSQFNGNLYSGQLIANPDFVVNDNLEKLRENWNDLKEQNGLKNLDTIEDLFGSLNYCDCEHCQSVLSPAAYFTDLMRFIENSVLKIDLEDENFKEKRLEESHPIHLKTRRPDLWYLELSCENTNKSIPYIETIIEVLSGFIKKHTSFTIPVEETLLNEKPDLEFSLPYNHTLEEVRTWLAYFNTKRIDLLEYLYPDANEEEKKAIAIERLSLSEETYNCIIDKNLNAFIDKNVIDFRLKTGLTPEETQQLVDLKFWNGNLEITQIRMTDDIQSFKLEFDSKLTGWQGVMHRIIRLWKATDWNLTELDIVLQTFKIQHDNLNEQAILDLGQFKKLQDLSGLNVEQLSGIWIGISKTHSEKKKLSWENLLYGKQIKDQKIKLEELKGGFHEAELLSLELQSIFGLNEQDILDLLTFLHNVTDTIKFTQDKLDVIYRYAVLYKWSGASSFDEFVQVLEIWDDGQNHYQNLTSEDLLSFMEFKLSLPLDITDLVYFFDKNLNEKELNTEDSEFLNQEEIKELINSGAVPANERFEALFNKWLGIENSILQYYKTFLEKEVDDLNSVFDDLSSDNPEEATIIKFTNVKNKLERLQYVFDLFEISSDLQIQIAEKSKTCKIFHFNFTDWNEIDWIKEMKILSDWVKETKILTNFNLIDLLANLDPSEELSDSVKWSISKWQKVSLSDVGKTVAQSDSISDLQKVWDNFKWSKALNISIKTLEKFKSDTSLNHQAQILKNAIRLKYADNESWENSIRDSQNALNRKLRDVLCNYVIFNKNIREMNFGFSNRESLYQYFLLDVEMGDCFMLPKIVTATNSLQVYINRCIMGLEQSADGKVKVILDIDKIDEWEWRKNYRVWEANRKIFLFPENYAEAEIRDNKTPEFKELEDELLQQKLNLEVVENAYKKYFEQIMKLAELQVTGAYRDKDTKRIYLFGKTNQQPHEFYYRHVEFLESGDPMWSNWEKMDISIPAEDVSAIMYNGKLHVFWISSDRRDIMRMDKGDSKVKGHTYNIFLNYSYLQTNKKWSPPQKIELGYRTNGPFDAFLRLKYFKKYVDTSGGNPEFQDIDYVSADSIRDNVLKEFERTVHRKPYPYKLKNQLKLGLIWSDKKEAIQDIYQGTTFTVKTLNIKVQVVYTGEPPFQGLTYERELDLKINEETIQFDAIIGQNKPPNHFNLEPRIVHASSNKNLTFLMEFNKENDDYKFSLKTTNISFIHQDKIKYKIKYKYVNKEVASGDVLVTEIYDNKPISELEYELVTIDMGNQKKVKSEYGEKMQTFILNDLKKEYNTYYDSFKKFHISSDDKLTGMSSYLINRLSYKSVLIPTNTNNQYVINQETENITFLWKKLSLGIETFLDTQSSQFMVADQIDYSKSFGNYFFELFFHIPMRIADHLNAAGKYREAAYWYEFVYNPTAVKNEIQAFLFDENWRFAAFRNIGIRTLQEIYTDPNTIEMYKRNPGNPHAIARLRLGAYQKHVVMKYLDNLLDWADNLFEQFTPESTSEARHLYNVVKTILGNKPQSTGKCQKTKSFTYSDIKNTEVNEFIYNYFTPDIPKNVIDMGKYNNPGIFDRSKHEPLRPGGPSLQELSEYRDSILKIATGLDNDTEAKYSAKKGYIAFPERSSKEDSAAFQRETKQVATQGQNVSEVSLTKSKFLGDKIIDPSKISSDTYIVSEQPYIFHILPVSAYPLFNPEHDLAFCFPHNKDFINYWDRVNDRIFKLNHCLDINGVKKQMPAYAPEIDPTLLARMVADGVSFDEIIAALNTQHPSHRFAYLIEKAKQYTGIVQSFGQSLFAAMEKKDAEELTLLRARHERNILTLTTNVKKRQLKQAMTNLDALRENRRGIEIRKAYYEQLIDEGLISEEITEQTRKKEAGSLRQLENTYQLAMASLALIPNSGSPFAMTYGGVQLKGQAAGLAGSLDAVAKINESKAITAGLKASHKRREQEWQFQVLNSSQEMISINEQIKNAEIAVQIAEYDLGIHQTSIEQYEELYEFYTTKFSDYDHYTFQVRQLQQLYRMAFNLASDMALQAQKAFEFERYGIDIPPSFIKNNNWNNKKLGLLAGERLNLQLMQLEQEFINTDKRKIEITQNFSMLQLAPDKLMELKMNGECSDFVIPEAAFDLIYPGYFRRIIKSVRVSIPCVAGPYTNIGATLTLGNNKIRANKDDSLKDFNFSGCATIATSTAQNDGGQFELNFRDEKYLPFEGAGAISSWALSLPKTVRPFDYNTISDVIFHISYTAEYDGGFKESVETSLRSALDTINGSGMFRLFSLRHDFPMEWHQLNDPHNTEDIILELRREHFPFFANISNIDSIGAKAYTLDSNNKWKEEQNNLGISKGSAMKIKVPSAVGKSGYKDVFFKIKYKCN